MYKEADIMHENGKFWVLRNKARKMYEICESGFTHSVSTCGFEMDDDGLSLAIAYCDYRASRCAF